MRGKTKDLREGGPSTQRSECSGRVKGADPRGGFVLILVLLIVAALMAVAVNFAYGVYVDASGIHNMQVMEELSVEGSSLIESSAGPFLQALNMGQIPLGGQAMEIPLDDGTTVYFGAGDENSKFNINTLVNQNGSLNTDALQSFESLLKTLGLDPDMAGKVAQWIRQGAQPFASAAPLSGGLSGAAGSSANRYLTSVPELKLIIDKTSYDTLRNYVTVFGDGTININTAPAQVLESLPGVSEDLAGRIIEWRKLQPFQHPGDLSKVAGFEGQLGQTLMTRIGASSSAVRVEASATRQGITRVVVAVLDMAGNVIYWREY